MTDAEFAQWVDAVLAGCKAPANPTNFDTLNAWSIKEGGKVHMNPLNTTWWMPGAIAWNTLSSGAHVWTYASVTDAITATLNTLLTPDPAVGLPNGYDIIVANLRNSLPRQQWQNACAQLDKWGTGCTWITATYGPINGGIETDMTDDELMALHDTIQFCLWGIIDMSAQSRNDFVYAVRHGTTIESIISGWMANPAYAKWNKNLATLPVPAELPVAAHKHETGEPILG